MHDVSVSRGCGGSQNDRFAERAGMNSTVERGWSEPHRVRPPSGGVRCWRSNSGHARPALIPVLSCGDHDPRELSPCQALHSLKSELRSHMQAMRVPPCPVRRRRPRVPDMEICRREHTGLAGHATPPGSDHPPAGKERSPQTPAERARATDRGRVMPAIGHSGLRSRSGTAAGGAGPSAPRAPPQARRSGAAVRLE
jgi:hypothetical protein